MMKKNRNHSETMKTNNQGFSLIELLVSIAILVIVMVPLMNNFFSSMKMNREAEAIQKRSNLAANIIEGLKSFDMTQTIGQFTGSVEDFNIIEDLSSIEVDDILMRLQLDSGGYIKYVENPLEEQSTYYFGMNGIEEDNRAYDVLIKMDAQPYQYIESHDGYLMNNYPMPDIINLDEQTNGMLFSNVWLDDTGTMYITEAEGLKNIDQVTLLTFQERGTVYARQLWEKSPEYLNYQEEKALWRQEYQQAVIDKAKDPSVDLPEKPSEPQFNASAPEYAIYCDISSITSLITKTMKIEVSEYTDAESKRSKISYQVQYQCAWTPDDIDKSITYLVKDQNYATLLQHIYLFYEPSIYDSLHFDEIEINNSNPANPVNLYIAKQENLMDPNIKIIRSTESDNVKSFTNLPDEQVKVQIGGFEIIDPTHKGITTEIIDTKKENRLYAVTVQICTYQVGQPKDKYKEVLCTLQSTREE